MKMNAHLHFVVNSALMDILKKEATERGVTISELCRMKILEGDRLKRIEEMLKQLVQK